LPGITGGIEGAVAQVRRPATSRDGRIVVRSAVGGGVAVSLVAMALVVVPLQAIASPEDRAFDRGDTATTTALFVRSTATVELGLERPAALTYSPSDHSLLIEGTDVSGRAAVVQASLAQEALGAPAPLTGQTSKGATIASVNPEDGLTYTAAPREQRVYGADASGLTKMVIDISDAGLTNVTGMTFAPSADPTDDPATTNLFLVDEGSGADGGQLVEMAMSSLKLQAPASLLNESAVVVSTIQTSQWSPPSPDPCALVWLPGAGGFIVADSEVDEMVIWAGSNLFETTSTGALTRTGSTTAFSDEPTGLGYRASDNTLLVSDDNANSVTFVNAGADAQFGTADDTRSNLDLLPQSDDAEDVAFDAVSGHVFVVDGVSTEVFRFDPGPDTVFGNADDVRTNFDVGVLGARDPEGIEYNPENDSLLVLDQPSRMVYEVAKDGALLRTIDIRAAASVAASGIALAPGSLHPDRINLWIADRVGDNGPDPNENDGRIYELSVGTSNNTPPTVSAVAIEQTSPKTNDVLSVRVTASDADGDALQYRYQWRKNGVALAGQTNPTLDLSVPGNGDKADVISVRVVAFDGIVESSPRTSSQVTIVNSPPAFTQDFGDRADEEGAPISLSAAAVDPDGDPVVHEATGLPSDVGIDPATGLITGTIASGAAGTYNVAVTARESTVIDATDTFVWTITPLVIPPPDAPTGLTATVTSVAVDLDWDDSADVAGYDVYRSAAAAGPYTRLNAALLTVSAFSDSTAPAGTSYFRVTAVDAGGLESVPAETSAVRPPDAPTGLTAVVTSVAVDLDWGDGAGVAGYNVYRSAAAGGPYTGLNASLLTTSGYSDREAPLGTSFYRVTAVDAGGVESVPAETSAARLVLFVRAASASVKDATRLALSKPIGTAAGDLLVAGVAITGTAAITPPAGWTVVQQTTSGTAMRQVVYTKVATSTEPASYAWTFAKSSAAGAVLTYRGATSVESSSGRANPPSKNITASSTSAGLVGSIVIGVFGMANNPMVKPPAGMVEQVEVAQNGGKAKVSIELADSIVRFAGSTGDRTATATQGGANVGQLLVIRP
jgi:hypothetical protein